jgi:hypothetical protein
MLLARQTIRASENVLRRSIDETVAEPALPEHGGVANAPDLALAPPLVRSSDRERAQVNARRPPPRPIGRAAASFLPRGSHLATPRRGYIHHGIYTGDGKVVHYAGLIRSPWFGCVEEIPLECFSSGHDVFVVATPTPRFSADEIVRRARSRLGEARYSVLRNNCEHFCAWCVAGAGYSEQVERWRAWFGRFAGGYVVARVWRNEKRPTATSLCVCGAQACNVLKRTRNSWRRWNSGADELKRPRVP